MEGERSPNSEELTWEDDPLVGIIPRSIAHLFSALNAIQSCEYSVKISFIELYNEELSDLLSESTENEKLRIFDDSARKGSVIIPGLEEVVVQNKSEVYRILQKGAERRQKASTLMNAQSSRSHSIFTITVFIKEKSLEGEETIKVGKLNLVDLAGSENIERSGATGKRAAEAGKINKSLTTLGRVITALVEHRDHVPYRESNLTRLLQDSLGGRTKTSIIATISPASCNLEETLSTLDYAHKAKSIRNKPEINQKLVKKALIKEYTEEIDRLKRELMSAREKNGIFLPPDLYQSMESKLEIQKEEIREFLLKIAALSEEMEKLNELFKDTKQNLEEKTEILYQTKEKLNVTEIKLEKVTEEFDETKYLMNEHIKSENKLFEQAIELNERNHEYHQDCTSLYAKIDRINRIAEQNHQLAKLFSSNMNEKLRNLKDYDSEMSHTNKSNVCLLCDALNEILTKIHENKDENVYQITSHSEKSQSWLKSQEELLKNEIEMKFARFVEEFCIKLNFLQEQNCLKLDNDLKICSEHQQYFTQIYTSLNDNLNELEKNSADFSSAICSISKNYLLTNSEEIANYATASVEKLNKLSESVEIADAEMKQLINFKENFQYNVSEMLKSLQTIIENFSNNANEAFEHIDTQCFKLRKQNAETLKEIATLKENIKHGEQSLVKKLSNDFDQNINGPINLLLEANSKNFAQVTKFFSFI
jgi:kinesin family member 11